MRAARFKSQREFEKKSGLNYAKVNRIENQANKRGIPIDDMERWLLACDSSLVAYLTEYASLEDLKKTEKDAKLLADIRFALRNPKTRNQLKAYVELLVGDAASDKGH